MTRPASFSCKLTEGQQALLREIISSGNYRPRAVPYTVAAAEAVGWKCSVSLYSTGKCLVQGGGAADFVENVLEPQVLKDTRFTRAAMPGLGARGGSAVGAADDDTAPVPHAGVDESGKGDVFGPLVIAAAFVDGALAQKLREAGARDCKLMASDAQTMKIGEAIRSILGRDRYVIVKIGNPAYNRMYARCKSVNRMLAWGHARCIESIVTSAPQCRMAISDQFSTKEALERALMKRGKEIEVRQRHRAESDVAVAAASVLAREAFLRALAEMGEAYGVAIPKGASSPDVRATAARIAKERGPKELLNVTKCHFRTIDGALADIGSSRNDLPPEGQVQSQAYSKGVSAQ